MNIHDATEQAYKRGYEAGVKEFAERLRKIGTDEEAYGYVHLWEVDHIAKELTESKNDLEG